MYFKKKLMRLAFLYYHLNKHVSVKTNGIYGSKIDQKRHKLPKKWINHLTLQVKRTLKLQDVQVHPFALKSKIIYVSRSIEKWPFLIAKVCDICPFTNYITDIWHTWRVSIIAYNKIKEKLLPFVALKSKSKVSQDFQSGTFLKLWNNFRASIIKVDYGAVEN